MPKKSQSKQRKRGKPNTSKKHQKRKKSLNPTLKSIKDFKLCIDNDEDEAIYSLKDLQLDDMEYLKNEEKIRSQSLLSKKDREMNKRMRNISKEKSEIEFIELTTEKLIKKNKEKIRVQKEKDKIVKVRRNTEKNQKGKYRKKRDRKNTRNKSKMDEEGLSYPFDNVDLVEDDFIFEDDDEYTKTHKPKKKRGKMDIERGPTKKEEFNMMESYKSQKLGKKINFDENTFENALACLQENYIPEKILCREKEKEKIYHYLKNSIQEGGTNESLCKKFFTKKKI